MSDLYTNAERENRMIRYAIRNNLEVGPQLCTENCIMFTVPKTDLQDMKNFCEKEFGSCEVVEDLGNYVMCKVV